KSPIPSRRAPCLCLCPWPDAADHARSVSAADRSNRNWKANCLDPGRHRGFAAGEGHDRCLWGVYYVRGVPLRAVLEKAGVGFGETLKGKRMASCLLVEAADDYRVVIALPEVDPRFTDKQVILAFLKDGKPLDDKEGPYRIVIPDEKRMARWVRQVTTLKIVEVQ